MSFNSTDIKIPQLEKKDYFCTGSRSSNVMTYLTFAQLIADAKCIEMLTIIGIVLSIPKIFLLF